jgi:hypothetical protein
MKTLILLASATVLASTPAIAKPDHAKHAAKAHQAHDPGAKGYGQGGCPPGLARKSPACVPPGQAKKQFKVGDRLPKDYKGYTSYSRIPRDLRRQHGLAAGDRYVYRDQRLYRVDPKTMVIQQVISAILR